jgi:hypothetical protein
MRRRRGLALFLLLGAAVLGIAVFAGNRMGDRVIGQVGQRLDLQPTIVPSLEATALSKDDEKRVFWKKSQVVTAATDPAFPDPRVTPPPTATPKPASPTPTPTPDAELDQSPATPKFSASPAPTVVLTPVPPPSETGGSPEAFGETPGPAATK